MSVKLTKSLIDQMVHEKSGGQDIRWCSDPIGFGVKVYPSGVKTFVLSFRFKGRKFIKKLGKFGVLAVEQARKSAKEKLLEINRGVNPFEKRVGKDKSLRELEELSQWRSRAESLSILSSLIPGIVHELNDQLTSVLAFSELILNSSPSKNEEEIENLSIIAQKAKRSAEILKNISTFFRTTKSSKEDVRVNDVVEKILDLKSYPLKVQNIQVKTELAGQLPVFYGNYAQVEQMILTLIANVEQRIGEDNRRTDVTIRTSQNGNRIRIEVEDNGTSIPAGVLQAGLGPDALIREMEQNKGLGISMCRGIVLACGGTLTAENFPRGRGVRVSIELPVPLKRDSEGKIESAVAEEMDGAGKVVLVVDDEESIVHYLGKIFRKNNFQVEAATNGKRALEIVRNRKIDLIVSDVKMPDINGVELVRQIAEIRPLLSNAIVFISGATDPDVEDLSHGSNIRFIQKPFGMRQIIQTAREVLSVH